MLHRQNFSNFRLENRRHTFRGRAGQLGVAYIYTCVCIYVYIYMYGVFKIYDEPESPNYDESALDPSKMNKPPTEERVEDV